MLKDKGADDKNPWNIKQVPYERVIVDFVDKLIEVANKNNSKGKIKSSLDWNTMEFLYKGWRILFPQTSYEFEKHMNDFRKLSKPNAIDKGRHGAMIQHQLEIPRPLYQMITTIWPNQKFDRKFVKEFAQRYPQFKSTTDSL